MGFLRVKLHFTSALNVLESEQRYLAISPEDVRRILEWKESSPVGDLIIIEPENRSGYRPDIGAAEDFSSAAIGLLFC